MVLYNDIDLNFFEKIDTEEKAYFLGFLYSDGGITTKDNSYSVSLKLHNKDIIVLEKLKNLISPSSPIKVTQGKYCYFRINRKLVCQQLINLGCHSKKSLTLKFPDKNQVPDNLISHFLRGYSDGDGSITYYRASNERKDFFWTIVSTNSFCQSVADLIKEKLNISCYIGNIDNSGKNNVTKRLVVGGNLQLSKILDWIYHDSHIHLDRKHDRYLDFKNQISKKYLTNKNHGRSERRLHDSVISLYAQGNSKIKIARLMNCNVKSIYNLLKKNNIATIKNNSYKRKNTVSSKAESIIMLYNNGATIKDIAHRFNCTTNNITIILGKNNIKIRRSNGKKELTQDQKDLILHLKDTGMGCGMIAKKLGFNKSFISRFLRKN